MRARHILLAVGLATGLPAITAQPLQAEETQPQTAEPFEQLALALSEPERNEAGFERMMTETLPNALKSDPNIAMLEQACPGATKAMLDGGRDNLYAGFQRDEAEFRAGSATIFREEMTPEEARQAAEFFSSAQGRKVFELAFDNLSLDSVIAEAIENEDGQVSEEALERDNAETARKVRDKFDPAEYAELNFAYRTAPWKPAFDRAMPRIAKLRDTINSKPPAPDDDALLEAAMSAALTAHMATCEPAPHEVGQ